jgi:hypothetical protein
MDWHHAHSTPMSTGNYGKLFFARSWQFFSKVQEIIDGLAPRVFYTHEQGGLVWV